MPRKTPIEHEVSGHLRDGKSVKPYVRGSGTRRSRSSKVVGSRVSMGDRIDVSAQALLGMKEGVDYNVLAYTDWADMFIPTIVKWSDGSVDDFSSPAKSMANRKSVIKSNYKKATDDEMLILANARYGVNTRDYPMDQLNNLMRRGMLRIVASKMYPDRRMAEGTYALTDIGNKEVRRWKG